MCKDREETKLATCQFLARVKRIALYRVSIS